MKVVFKNMINGYVGLADDLIFYYHPRLNRILARRKPVSRLTAHKVYFGNVSRNLMSLDPSQDYVNDLKTYAERTYNVPEFGGIRPLWNNLYMKLMYGLKALYPDIDLLNLTRATIYAVNMPCITVKRAVEAGLLPPVRNYEQLTNSI
jgi:hypothetical protein